MAMLRLNAIDRVAVAILLARFGLELQLVGPNDAIAGSYWGHAEAGLLRGVLYARLATPVHSVLHELARYVCMSPERRSGLDRDAGGDGAEDSAVRYLQVLLADELVGVGRARLLADMDEWGYSFRRGSARAWFESDADDARAWLVAQGIIDVNNALTAALRC
jgi:hypothetical protein